MARHAWVRGTLLGESRGGVVNKENQDTPSRWSSGYRVGKKRMDINNRGR